MKLGMIKKLIVFLFAVLLTVSQTWIFAAKNEDGKITNPVGYYIKKHTIRPITEMDKPTELVKIEADFNNDGLFDMAVSDTSEWSNSNGGQWDFFLRNPDKTYAYVWGYYFSPYAITIQPMERGKALVTISWHMSVDEYGVAEFFFISNQIKEGKNYIDTVKVESDSKESPNNESEQETSYRPEAIYCYVSAYLDNNNCEWETE